MNPEPRGDATTVDTSSDVIHFTCCHSPEVGLCGWPVEVEASPEDRGPVCVVCDDLACFPCPNPCQGDADG